MALGVMELDSLHGLKQSCTLYVASEDPCAGNINVTNVFHIVPTNFSQFGACPAMPIILIAHFIGCVCVVQCVVQWDGQTACLLCVSSLLSKPSHAMCDVRCVTCDLRPAICDL